MNRLENHLSARRLGLCLRRDMKPHSRSSFIVLAATLGFLFIVSALDAGLGRNDPGFHAGVFHAILMIGGFLFVSGLFREVHRKETNQTYLMLPASSLEKVLSRLILATIGWGLFTLVWFSLFSLASEGLNMLFFGRSHRLFNPFTTKVWLTLSHFSVLQSVFLLGAIIFRKLHFFKTVLSLAILTIAFSLFGALLVRIIFADYFNASLMFGGESGLSLALEELSLKLSGSLVLLRNILYWLAFPLVSWTIVYIRFREVEIKDGV